MNKYLVWFRNDLRIHDNPALHYACTNPEALVSGVFVATPKQWEKHFVANCQINFIYKNLLELKKNLLEIQIELIIHTCKDFIESADWIFNFCHRNKISKLYFNRQYEYNEKKRDNLVKLKLHNITECITFNGNLLISPKQIMTQKIKNYRVYRPFLKRCTKIFSKNILYILPPPKIRKYSTIKNNLLEFDRCEIFNNKKYNYFLPGENYALKKLKKFVDTKLNNYHINRDFFSINSTSQLSPYLTVGALSASRCLYLIKKNSKNFTNEKNPGLFKWYSELIWREFYQHLMIAYPFLSMSEPFLKWTNKICWENNPKYIKAWKNGSTGYPIIDASMHQLKQTGWLHNRLRMISASFLVKNLFVDWRIGEKYFISHLIDGNLSSNNGGWQWSASTGTDSAPYFRIFNPILQGKKFDHYGNFIRFWIPELSAVPDHCIHFPHNWAVENNIKIHYPAPIVQYKTSYIKFRTAYLYAKNNLK
ncbi:FAD-binding deoxyribodipyrimidine photolyase [Wigglesworthia glossinidia endosymbiont of Glossina morsitans morsitans (Yale colony)]|uniref:Deoxyribodipyrimidine photo-lyase n=1 Tax=Wigglesworthia glossinidia endosymbiont of Glossina morsitans morsitans (Yale colony) TaxID=1142511 RepID=H6Q5D2_WIGGL|nr:deoxyribodipyrimidine photo-lyase [Wigglesworthia glossinidia]AFA41415.1 FAD-binding deoxyribodipyrimidine photolyase [Wigglesworthia glossinidia endosymbiont of Glossina morsitans morsitans (Yale colony)]